MTQLATLGPIGNLPKAPGTWGSLATVIAALPVILFLPDSARMILLIACLISFCLGVVVSQEAAKELGRKDPGSVVIDEVAGQLLVLAFAPLSLFGAVIAFGLFRLFDIAKPPPVKQFERLPGGLGIMADDMIAGVYGVLVIVIAAWIGSSFV